LHRFLWLFGFLAFVLIGSIPRLRAIVAWPLVVSNESAEGDACYVLAAGNAIWERLAAASDLYHMNRVRKILLMRNDTKGPYNFPRHASLSPTQWETAYLSSRGVPTEDIVLIRHADGLFGTFAESRNVAHYLPPEIKRLVIVTSPPHTRRSLLTFKRALHGNVAVVPYSAVAFEASAELYDPLWLEYMKLVVYAVFLFP